MSKAPARYKPPTMHLTFVFNPGCEECCRVIASMTSQAIRESRVTGWKTTKGTAHIHEVAADDAPHPPLPTPPPPCDTLFEVPRSDTNGFDTQEF